MLFITIIFLQLHKTLLTIRIENERLKVKNTHINNNNNNLKITFLYFQYL